MSTTPKPVASGGETGETRETGAVPPQSAGAGLRPFAPWAGPVGLPTADAQALAARPEVRRLLDAATARAVAERRSAAAEALRAAGPAVPGGPDAPVAPVVSAEADVAEPSPRSARARSLRSAAVRAGRRMSALVGLAGAGTVRAARTAWRRVLRLFDRAGRAGIGYAVRAGQAARSGAARARRAVVRCVIVAGRWMSRLGGMRRRALPWWWPVAAGMAGGLLCGAVYTVLASPQYAARGHVMVRTAEGGDPAAALGLAQLYGRLADDPAVLREAGRLPGEVRASTSPDAPVIEITGTAREARAAAAVANAVAPALVAYGNAAEAQGGAELAVLSRAVPPAGPSSPTAPASLGFGACTGGVVGCLVLLARAYRWEAAAEGATA